MERVAQPHLLDGAEEVREVLVDLGVVVDDAARVQVKARRLEGLAKLVGVREHVIHLLGGRAEQQPDVHLVAFVSGVLEHARLPLRLQSFQAQALESLAPRFEENYSYRKVGVGRACEAGGGGGVRRG